MSSVFLVVEPSKIMFLIKDTIPQKEFMILLYIGYHSIYSWTSVGHIGYHSITKTNTTQMCVFLSSCNLPWGVGGV